MVRVQLSCVAFCPPGSEVAVTGGVPELGNWSVDAAVRLTSSLPINHHLEPSFWTAIIDLDPLRQQGSQQSMGLHDLANLKFEYKFIRRPKKDISWEWEGSGSHDNRKFYFDPENVVEGVYVLPPVQYLDPAGISEATHTTRFYNHIKETNSVHYNTVFEHLIVGSCPRSPAHIKKFRDMGVTAVLNLQAEEDIKVNFPDPDRCKTHESRTIDHIAAMYAEHAIAFTWMPTTDMSTPARARMVAQAAWVLYGLISNGHKCYVHCNAGVGRAVAAACGYICFVLGYSIRKTNLTICSKRPMAFFDEKAMREGHEDFKRKFGALIPRPPPSNSTASTPNPYTSPSAAAAAAAAQTAALNGSGRLLQRGPSSSSVQGGYGRVAVAPQMGGGVVYVPQQPVPVVHAVQVGAAPVVGGGVVMAGSVPVTNGPVANGSGPARVASPRMSLRMDAM